MPVRSPSAGWTTPLLFGIIVIAAADRQIMALLKPILDSTFGWSAKDYAAISTFTQVASACSLLVAGWLVDRLGPKRTLGIAMTGWSLMTILHAVARTVVDFICIRSALGALEGAGMPSLMKVIATSIARKKRAKVIGYLNAAPNLAAILTPFLVTVLLSFTDWRSIVIGLGGAGLLLALLWQLKATPAPSERTSAYNIHPSYERKADIRRMFTVFSASKVFSDATWWITLFWLPDILHSHFHLTMQATSTATGIVYIGAAAGAMLGGVLPARLQVITGSHEIARRLIMGVAALCIMPMSLIFVTSSLPLGIGLLTLALLAHQVFSSNLFGIATEWMPSVQVGRLTGVGAFCGNLGGASLLWLTGFVPMPFILAGCGTAYFAAWGVLAVGASPRWLERAFPQFLGANI
ncbi:MFS transporter [Acetobacter sp.]|uniref:MFS transporter n=1 Tax=Acetobacter sp. TaxID=440 RepID=UPI0025C1D4F4|nr:MFS transporter [Acetobacter sp.]MCH4089901.1 MFS transporter [Acetobacter sp.]MCI1298597.1 MFS transporter [Acetobacter sp.]MCI1315162.1 MFS transporter [Acetobacter sp.]